MSLKPQTQCPDCSKVLKLKSDTLYGRKTKCPSCSSKFIIEPYPPEAVIEEEEDEDDFGFEEEDFGFGDSPVDDDYGFGEASSGPLKPKKVVKVKTEEERLQDELRQQRRKFKKKKKQYSPAFQIMAWIAGGSIAGLMGAIIWATIIYFTDRELGLVAWGIGGLVGFGVLSAIQMTGGGASPGAGVIAAVISVFSIFLGKAVGIYLLLQGMFVPLADTELLVDDLIFDIVVEEIYVEYEENGTEDDEIDYELVEKEAEKRIQHAKPEQKAKWEAEAAIQKAEFEQALQGGGGTLLGVFIAVLGAIFSVGILDILFFGLAIATAYKLASGGYDPM